MPDSLKMRMPTPAGERREVLDFYKPSGAPGRYGQPGAPPDLLLEGKRGKVEPLTGRELDEARRVAPLATLKITVDSDPMMIDETFFIIHRNRQNLRYNIGHVQDIETRNREWVLFCHREAC